MFTTQRCGVDISFYRSAGDRGLSSGVYVCGKGSKEGVMCKSNFTCQGVTRKDNDLLLPLLPYSKMDPVFHHLRALQQDDKIPTHGVKNAHFQGHLLYKSKDSIECV